MGLAMSCVAQLKSELELWFQAYERGFLAHGYTRSSRPRFLRFYNEENCSLILELGRKLGAERLGTILGFFRVDHDFVCPSCLRGKREIARIAKFNSLHCPIFEHHDHFGDDVAEDFRRFEATLVCGDCNNIDTHAKVALRVPSCFSFSPSEIKRFVIRRDNARNEADLHKARKVYREAKKEAARLWDTLCGYLDASDRAESEIDMTLGCMARPSGQPQRPALIE